MSGAAMAAGAPETDVAAGEAVAAARRDALAAVADEALARGAASGGAAAAGLRFAGYAALFDRRDAGKDLIRRGAFARTLAEREARRGARLPLFWQHRPDVRIGWIDTAREDDRGLRVVATIDNPRGGAAAALKAGKVTGLSFGYRARGFVPDGVGRELRDIELFEVSLVTHPMQAAARVHMIAPAA